MILLIAKDGISDAIKDVPEVTRPYLSTVSFVYVPTETPVSPNESVISLDSVPPPVRPIPALTEVVISTFPRRSSTMLAESGKFSNTF